jgi:hypothetical protein
VGGRAWAYTVGGKERVVVTVEGNGLESAGGSSSHWSSSAIFLALRVCKVWAVSKSVVARISS